MRVNGDAVVGIVIYLLSAYIMIELLVQLWNWLSG